MPRDFIHAQEAANLRPEMALVESTPEEKQETEQELLEKSATIVSDFETAGLPEAEKIAAEFGVEVDEEVKRELKILELEAKQAKEIFGKTLRSFLFSKTSKILEKVAPNSGVAEGFKHEAGRIFDNELHKKLQTFESNPPEDVEELIALYRNQEKYSTNKWYSSHLNGVTNKFLLKILEERGWKESINIYNKIPDQYNVDNGTGFKRSLIRTAVREIYGKDEVELNLETAQPLFNYFKGNLDSVLIGINNGINLDSESLSWVIENTPNNKNNEYWITSNIFKLDEKDFEKVKVKVFEALVNQRSSQIIHYMPRLRDLINSMPPERYHTFISELINSNTNDVLKAIHLFDIPEDLKPEVWKKLLKGGYDTYLVPGLLNNEEGLKKLGITRFDVIDGVLNKDNNINHQLFRIKENNYSKEELDFLTKRILDSKNSKAIFGNFNEIKDLLTTEQIEKQVADQVRSNDLRGMRQMLLHTRDLTFSEDQKQIIKLKVLNDGDNASRELLVREIPLLNFSDSDILEIISSLDENQSSEVLAEAIINFEDKLPGKNVRELKTKLAESKPSAFLKFSDRLIKNSEDQKLYAQQLYHTVLVSRDFSQLSKIAELTQQSIEYQEVIREIVVEWLKELTPSEYLDQIVILEPYLPKEIDVNQIPLTLAYKKLLNLQARSSKGEYDPWKTDLDPLVKSAENDDLIKKDDVKSLDALIDYVQNYGMSNLPTLYKWHAKLSEVGNLNELSEDVRKEIEADLGIRLDKFKNRGELTKEIKKFRKSVQESILMDEVHPALVESKIGNELFALLKGSTQWEKGDDPKSLINRWLEFKNLNPELAKIPEGYNEVSFEVPIVIRRDTSLSEQERREKKENEILSNSDLVKSIKEFKLAFLNANHKDSEQWWKSVKNRILDELAEKQKSIAIQISTTTNDQAKIGMENQIRNIDESIHVLKNSELPGSHEEILENILKVIPKKFTSRDLVLKEATARQAWEIMPDGFKQTLTELSANSSSLNVEEVIKIRDFLVAYMNEHYLNPSQEEHQTNHKPFSGDLLEELRNIYGMKPNFEKNILNLSYQKLISLEEGNAESTSKTTTVTLVPAKGVLRIYSGDIGNACYTSQHNNLAKGEYPNLTAFTFVTGKGTDNERLNGSVLAIETETPAGERVLLVRANNPKENLLNQVDSKVLLENTLAEMKALALRRGINKVVVPRDNASASCSNRAKVAGYYAEKYVDAPKVQLVESAETSFNGYKNWDAEGLFPVVEI